jgi:hypothetical protein
VSIGAFGKAVAPIAKKIGEEVVEGMAKSAAPKAAAKTADDWGWKGGKPGEITGSEYENARRSLTDLFGNTTKTNRAKLYKLNQKLLDQVSGSGLENRFMHSLAGDFADLEQAGVPREWTGKVVKAVGRPLWEVADTSGASLLGKTTQNARTPIVFSSDIARGISDAMRSMTNSQRETFLSLLPEWTGSLDDLAKAAKLL